MFCIVDCTFLTEFISTLLPRFSSLLIIIVPILSLLIIFRIFIQGFCMKILVSLANSFKLYFIIKGSLLFLVGMLNLLEFKKVIF